MAFFLFSLTGVRLFVGIENFVESLYEAAWGVKIFDWGVSLL